MDKKSAIEILKKLEKETDAAQLLVLKADFKNILDDNSQRLSIEKYLKAKFSNLIKNYLRNMDYREDRMFFDIDGHVYFLNNEQNISLSIAVLQDYTKSKETFDKDLLNVVLYYVNSFGLKDFINDININSLQYVDGKITVYKTRSDDNDKERARS